jgi:hypothetical protein
MVCTPLSVNVPPHSNFWNATVKFFLKHSVDKYRQKWINHLDRMTEEGMPKHIAQYRSKGPCKRWNVCEAGKGLTAQAAILRQWSEGHVTRSSGAFGGRLLQAQSNPSSALTTRTGFNPQLFAALILARRNSVLGNLSGSLSHYIGADRGVQMCTSVC